MRVAIPYWQGRVSPVFDEARCLMLVEVFEGREVARETRTLVHRNPWGRTLEVAHLGTEVLICGAISKPLEIALCEAGITVYAKTCGPVEEVLAAFFNGRLEDKDYIMPGCGRRRGHLPRPRRRRRWKDG